MSLYTRMQPYPNAMLSKCHGVITVVHWTSSVLHLPRLRFLFKWGDIQTRTFGPSCSFQSSDNQTYISSFSAQKRKVNFTNDTQAALEITNCTSMRLPLFDKWHLRLQARKSPQHTFKWNQTFLSFAKQCPVSQVLAETVNRHNQLCIPGHVCFVQQQCRIWANSHLLQSSLQPYRALTGTLSVGRVTVNLLQKCVSFFSSSFNSAVMITWMSCVFRSCFNFLAWWLQTQGTGLGASRCTHTNP